MGHRTALRVRFGQRSSVFDGANADHLSRRPGNGTWPPSCSSCAACSTTVATCQYIELSLVISRMLGARAWYLEHGRPDRHDGRRDRLLDVLVRQVAVTEVDEWEQRLLERGTGGPAVAVSVGARIRHRRAEVGLTQAQLAGMLGVERSTVVRWEADERAPHAGTGSP